MFSGLQRAGEQHLRNWTDLGPTLALSPSRSVSWTHSAYVPINELGMVIALASRGANGLNEMLRRQYVTSRAQ